MRIKDEEKIIQIIEFMSKKEIDVVMMIETNLKWIILAKSIMMNKIKKLGRGVEFIFMDSKAHKTTKSDWSQEEMMNIIRGKYLYIIIKDKIKKDEMGR